MSSANAHVILPRLWLGNKKAASDVEFLRKHNITVVFNATKDYPFTPHILRKYRVPVDDNLEPSEIEALERWAPEIVYKVISEYNRGETILIHCHAGMQRSAAITAMVLITMAKISADDAMAYIRSRRPIAFFPGANFEKAIRGFERRYTAAMASQ